MIVGWQKAPRTKAGWDELFRSVNPEKNDLLLACPDLENINEDDAHMFTVPFLADSDSGEHNSPLLIYGLDGLNRVGATCIIPKLPYDWRRKWGV